MVSWMALLASGVFTCWGSLAGAEGAEWVDVIDEVIAAADEEGMRCLLQEGVDHELIQERLRWYQWPYATSHHKAWQLQELGLWDSFSQLREISPSLVWVLVEEEFQYRNRWLPLLVDEAWDARDLEAMQQLMDLGATVEVGMRLFDYHNWAYGVGDASGDQAFVEALLERGARVSSLASWVDPERLPVLATFLDYGADPTLGVIPAGVGGHGETLWFLLEQGADPNRVVPFAAVLEDMDLLDAALGRGADINYGWRVEGFCSHSGIPPALHQMADRDNIEMIQALLERGADPAHSHIYAYDVFDERPKIKRADLVEMMTRPRVDGPSYDNPAQAEKMVVMIERTREYWECREETAVERALTMEQDAAVRVLRGN